MGITTLSAGQPDWNKLAAMGRLPKDARNKIPLLAQLDTAEARVKELEEENARLRAGGGIDPETKTAPGDDEQTTQLKCDECGAILGGKTETLAKMAMGRHKAKHERERDKTKV